MGTGMHVHVGEVQAALRPQLAEARADSGGGTGVGALDVALAFEHLDDGRCIQPAHLAQVARLFEQPHVVVRVETIAALAAPGARQSQTLPAANGGG